MGTLKQFFKFFKLMDKSERRGAFILLLFILMGGVVETLGIAIILPVITVFLDPQIVERNLLLGIIYDLPFIGYTQPNDNGHVCNIGFDIPVQGCIRVFCDIPSKSVLCKSASHYIKQTV
jgi:hypothetical protein